MPCTCELAKKLQFSKAITVSVIEEKTKTHSFPSAVSLFLPVEQDIMAADYYPYPKLQLNTSVLKSLYSLSHFSFTIPNQNGILLKLNVCEHSIYENGEKKDNERYFHGVIEGVKSFVSLSVFGEKLYAVVSYEEDSLDIFPFQNNMYKITRNADVPFKELKCELHKKVRNVHVTGDFKDAQISVHWDVAQEYDEGYLKSLFSIVKSVYENEGISIVLEGISLFGKGYENYKNSTNSEVSQLLDFKNGEENIIAQANFDTLCQKSESYSYTELVLGSLTLNGSLLSHNLGHNFGAEHTSGDCGTINDLMGFCHNGRLPLLTIGFNTDVIRMKTAEFANFKPKTIERVVSVPKQVPVIKQAPVPKQAPVAPKIISPVVKEKPSEVYMIKKKKGKVYKRKVGAGEVVVLKLKGKKYRQLDWELKDGGSQIKSSHPSGTKFYKGDTVVTHRITSPQGQTDLQITIRVVSK
jgi:hypothetical protein